MLADHYDVVIVGGGTAGCAAALCLPPGTKALLVDRARDDHERCCGGLLATDAQKALLSLDLRLPDDIRVQPEPSVVHAFDVDSGREQSYRRDYLNVNRELFDRWLLDLAAERVEIAPHTSFVGVDGELISLRCGEQTATIHAGVLIGADGANSTVRRRCFADHPGPPTMVALQGTLAAGASRSAGGPGSSVHEVLFASELTDYYAWLVPKGDTVLVGSAFLDTHLAKERFARILDWYRERLGLGDEILGRSARRLSRPQARHQLYEGRGNVLLVGEAAGLVSPSSGEGISFALLSGAAAGRALGTSRPAAAYRSAFSPLARGVIAKTAKARVIYSPRLRAIALRLPWYP